MKPPIAYAVLASLVISIGLAAAATRPTSTTDAASSPMAKMARAVASLTSGPPPGPARRIVVWEGVDLDGDGAPDVANPTGHAPRTWDAYGGGGFGVSRDGGSRSHVGVDYAAAPGQQVRAPISGFVSKIGYPYAADTELRYVEITNPALRISARAFYVAPGVAVGDAIAVGQPIGQAQTLQSRYPGGMTDHIHLELTDAADRHLDPSAMILARRG